MSLGSNPPDIIYKSDFIKSGALIQVISFNFVKPSLLSFKLSFFETDSIVAGNSLSSYYSF